MQSFNIHRGKSVPMMNDNINTDQILPSRFLSHIRKASFGKFLFANWRYSSENLDNFVDDPTFVLNKPEHAGATILVTGDNFAGGSSREHAVWALDGFGFRVVIAGSFSDIFYNNSVKNGLLAITLPFESRQYIANLDADNVVTVDLPQQEVRVDDQVFHFEIDQEVKHKLLNGIDDITETMEFTEQITEYENEWNKFYTHQ